MAENSKIEWCDHTFNPWIGCTRLSPACDHCYAESMARRYRWAVWGAGEARRMAAASTWKLPEKWNRAAAAAGVRRRVFCSSLADVFDAEVPDEWRVLLFEKIVATPHLDWLLLTKRPQVAAKWFDGMPAPRNVWLGTTVENQKMADLRIPILLGIPGIKVRFLSMEPLLGPVDLTAVSYTHAPGFFGDALAWHHRGKCHEDEGLIYPAIDWVIAGGESGPGARASHPAWFRTLRDHCAAAGVPFFFKQWGEWAPSTPEAARGNPRSGWRMLRGYPALAKVEELYRENGAEFVEHVGKVAAGALLDGVEHRQFPAVASLVP